MADAAVAALVVGGFAVLSGCDGRQGGAPPTVQSSASVPTSPEAGETIVHIEDDGKSFDVARGSIVTFALTRHSGTGYAWKPSHVEGDALVQQGDREGEGGSGVPGAPKMDVYRFLAENAGSSAVEMSLARHFGDAAAAGVLHVTFRVQ